MSYIGSWKLCDCITFYANTHCPCTGFLKDADAVPSYRIYEAETTTPLLTGCMALLDNCNTVGWYSETITPTAAAGFEKGKPYAIRIIADVGCGNAGAHHTFQIEAEVDANTISAAQSTAADIADAIWDENIECAHGCDATAGLLLRALGAGISNRTANATLDSLLGITQISGVTLQSLLSHRVSTAQAGAAGTITLDACAVATADYYNDTEVTLLSGTGAGQTRRITDYNACTKVACVAPNWTTNPDCTSVFHINTDIASAGSCVTASSVADAVWNEGVACHQCTGTFGAGYDACNDRIDANVTAMAANTLTSSAIASGAITATGIAACAIGASEIAADAATEIADAVWATTITEPANIPVLGTDDAKEFMGFLGAALVNPVEVTSTQMRVRCGCDSANIASYTLSDDCTTFERSAGS